MPVPTDDRVSRALLQSLKDGTYPDSEDIISADLQPSALATELEFIRDAREEVKNDIRRLSRESAPNVDGWISQAKQLHADIERSRVAARKIIQDHEHGRSLQSNVQDASAKVHLLRGEIQFNDVLINTLGVVQDLDARFSDVKDSLANDHFLEAISRLDEIHSSIKRLGSLKNSRVVRLLEERAADMRNYILEDVQRIWNSLVVVDRIQVLVQIHSRSETSNATAMDLEATVSAFGKLGLLSAKIEALRDDVEGALLTPLLSTRSATDRQAHVYVNEGLISLHDGMKTGTEGLFDDIKLIMKTLNMLLPSKVARPLSQKLMSSIVSKLTSSWLLRSLPVDIPGMEQFQSEVFLVSKFANAIESSGWSRGAELLAWIDDIPRAWLAKRRESSLDDVRRLLLSQRQGTKEVERIEKQKVSRRDDVFVQNSGGDDWDAGWSNEDEDDKPQKQSSSAETDDEDVSAWGLDEGGDQTEVDALNHNKASSEDDDGGDAWGWDDEGDGAETESPTTHKTAQSTPKRENKRAVATVEPSEREYVLRETYHITDIPETLLELILTQLRDASVLSQEGKSSLPIAPAAGGLQTIPTLILAMFRAAAPSLYTYRTSSSNMYLYNDCMYLSEKLRALLEDQSLTNQTSSSKASIASKMEPDIVALEKFGKLAYGKEMESQRRVIGDLLDGAQGFTNCSEYPFSSECETAISSVVDWMRTLNTEWKDILSHSALLQSSGSLLSTVINKIIVDVEDMNDISEPESQRLTAFCARVSKLEDLFTPESSSENEENGQQQEPMPLTALYTANWLKFQYLANILDSSLADIKYMWTDGELGLEFTAEEVTDLIEALFADSDHRRRAIGEIRRTSRGH